jgi:hypothetical protein
MSAERKADMEAALAELAFEIELALKQGRIADAFHWMMTATGPDDAPWIAALTIIPRRRPFTKPPATAKAIMDAVFEGVGDAGEREGNKLVVPSGYVVDVHDVATALLERFEITEPDDGN